MSPYPSALSVLRGIIGSDVVNQIDNLIDNAPDHRLNRINALTFAHECQLSATKVVDGFLHATRLGIFDMSWNVVCPVCGGVLSSTSHLKDIQAEGYDCALCALHHKPTLDDNVEITFTVNPQTRAIAAHHPDNLPFWDHARQLYWSSGAVLPDNFEDVTGKAAIAAFDLSSGATDQRLLEVTEGTVVVFDPVTHSSTFIDFEGEVSPRLQTASIIFDGVAGWRTSKKLRPGKVRIDVENLNDRRVLPIIWRVGDPLRSLVGNRVPTLSGSRLLSNQTFQDLHGKHLFEANQHFEIKSLTFLFSDIRGSTALYERIGDLAAFDLVRLHFETLKQQISRCGGSLVKTMGDAVMATFASPLDAVNAAFGINEVLATEGANFAERGLSLRMGIHCGPCLAVDLDGRPDYFGQTVNTAARIQGAAKMHAITASKAVSEADGVQEFLQSRGLTTASRPFMIRGLDREIELFEITPTDSHKDRQNFA